MQRRFRLVERAAIAAAMLALTVSSAVAQGGKAEPLRISFKRGAYSATISESVRGDEEAEYGLCHEGSVPGEIDVKCFQQGDNDKQKETPCDQRPRNGLDHVARVAKDVQPLGKMLELFAYPVRKPV